MAEVTSVAARIVWRGTPRQTSAKLDQVGIVILRLSDQGQKAERWSAYRMLTDEQGKQ